MVDDSQLLQIGRLAMRVEGQYWNAYFAQQGTMERAILLSSIKLSLVDRPERKAQFQTLMRDCFGDTCEQLFGHRPEWEKPIKAPEHERTKE